MSVPAPNADPRSAPRRGPRRVGLYGGSFDPPHNGHVLLATWALCRAPIDELWLLPTGGHAFGKALTPFSTRCELVELAFSHLGPRVRIEPIEDTLPSPSYTIQTLEALRARHPEVEFSLLLGADAYLSRHAWKNWAGIEDIIQGRILVVGRDGREGEAERGASEVSVTLPDFSSTAVRRAVAASEPCWWMLPRAVGERVQSLGLYR